MPPVTRCVAAMTDFAMCSGEGCGVRSECYRHVSTPGDWQVWFARPPREEKFCMWLMPLRGGNDDKSDCNSTA